MSLIESISQGRLQNKIDESSSVYEAHTLELVSDVITKYSPYPTTGIFSEENLQGWLWSKTFPQNLEVRSKRINNSLGGHLYNLEEGSILNNWQGSVSAGIDLLDIEVVEGSIRTKWIPKYSLGEYSIYYKHKHLYSNYSCSQVLVEPFFSSEEEAGESEDVTNYVPGQIFNESIALFKRDKRFVNFPFYTYIFDETLAEDSSYYLSYDSDTDQTEIVINFCKHIKVGGHLSSVQQEEATLNTWEYVGKGNQGRSLIYTEYFPIKPGSVKLIEKNVDVNLSMDNNWANRIKWAEVDAFTHTNKNEFIVDETKGLITINNQEPNVTYKIKSIEEGLITFYRDLDNVKSTSGVFTSDGVNYPFIEKLANCLFVDDATTLVMDSIVTFKPQGRDFELGNNLYVAYEAVPRIDYEIYSNENENLTRSNLDCDLKPYTSSDSAGLIEINPYEKHISRLEILHDLDPDQSLIMGVETTKVTAIAYNSSGGRVKEAEVVFHCDAGLFNNNQKQFTSVTNEVGEAYAYYYWPYNEADSYSFITGDNVQHESVPALGNLTITKLHIAAENISTDFGGDLFLFQVLKIDPFYGYFGEEYTIIQVLAADQDRHRLLLDKPLKNEEEYITNQMMFPENEMLSSSDELPFCQESTNNYGLGYVEMDTGIYRKVLIQDVLLDDRILIKASLREGETFVNKTIKLFKRSELRFDPSLVEDRGFSFDRLMFKDGGGDELEPIKPAASGIVDVDGSKMLELTFIANLPLADLINDLNIVAGYKIFLNRRATLTATALDPASGRSIQSNLLRIEITLPEYLKGGSGFKLLTGEETDIKSTGFGGSNFLTLEQYPDLNPIVTINPFRRDGINIIL
jgi:hypothetical protein